MDSIEAQRSLSDKDLTIFNAELQRRSKSTGLTYVLWFFFGFLGVHNFYMGKGIWGFFYLGLGALGSFSFLATAAEVGMLSFGILGLLLLWDLFTIPSQVRHRENKSQRKLLGKLGDSG